MTAVTYKMGEELGRGALGRVVVITSSTGERFAGKILHPSNQADERARSRFVGEAKIAAGLRHRNVAEVHGLVELDGNSVLLMELVLGRSLAAIIAESAPVPEERVLDLGSQLAAGLGAAHRAGLIHRDLKPDNVLVTSVEGAEVLKIVDFGLARATSFEGVDAGAFAVVGTPDYMAPESIDPLAVDSRSDLYALGCILFEMITAQPPHSGATAFAVIEAHRSGEIDRSTLDALASRPLADLVAGLLAKSPADRPQSASQVKQSLSDAARSDTALAIASATTMSTVGTCAACGAPSVPDVMVCFGCGLQQAQLERGGHTVFVTGPGETTDKLDTVLRQKLVDWLEANPALGIAPGRLAKKVPRLPFVLATKVSEVSGRALARALESLGFETAVEKGGRLSLPAMRKKGVSLGGRFALIGVSGLAYGLHNVIGPALLPIVALGGASAIGGGFFSATRAAADQSGEPRQSLPPELGGPIARVAAVVPSIEHARHRESLRGVVQRALSVRAVGEKDPSAALDASLGELVDLAVASVLRIDTIDKTLAATDMRNVSAENRVLLHERDSLAGRLLEITAFLDSMRARLVALAASGDKVGRGDELDELRAHIEALEEVESL